MPIRPTGSTIYIAGTAVLVNAVKYSFDVEFFERAEFSNEKLRQAKNEDGSKPMFIELYGGRIAQILTTCNATGTTRPVTPDDDNIDNIKRRWDVRRYTILGDISQTGVAQMLQTYNNTHRKYLARYQAHLAQAQMDLSYAALQTMQSEAFTYITTTGLSMYGNAITPAGVLTSGASSGTSALVSSIASEFVAGQYVLVGLGTGTAEIKLISSIAGTTINLSSNLASNHSAGERVNLVETDLLVTDFKPDVEREYMVSGTPVVRKVWEATIENRTNRTARYSS